MIFSINWTKIRTITMAAIVLGCSSSTASSWYWQYSVYSNGSTGWVRCGDPVACAKGALIANWSYPSNGYWGLKSWKSCYYLGEVIMTCVAVINDSGTEGSGGANLVCEAGETQTGSTCTKLERDPSCNTAIDNPVDAKLGAKNEDTEDFKSYVGPLQLRRYYSTAYGIPGVKSESSARFGRVWRSNFDVALTIQSAETDFFAVLPNGVTRRFSLQNGQYVPREYNRTAQAWQDAPHVREKIKKVGANYQLVTEDSNIYKFDSNGDLVTIEYTTGYSQNLTWAGGKNVSVVDSFGQVLSFSYGANGFVSEVRLPDGAVIKYQYQNKSTETEPVLHTEYALTKVLYPDATPADDADNPILQYHYEDARFIYALTGKTDARGVRTRTWSYDNDGRVSKVTLPANQGSYDFSYDVLNGSTSVTNPLGKKTIYRYAGNTPGVSRLTAIDGLASANCAADNTSFGYDNNGFVSSQIDGEGRKSTFTYDNRGNPVSITRGVP